MIVKDIFGEDLEKSELPDDLVILNISLNKVTTILLSVRSVFSGTSRYNILISLLLISLGVINIYAPVIDLICQFTRYFILVFSIALFVPPIRTKILKFKLFHNNITSLRNFLVVDKKKSVELPPVIVPEKNEFLKKENTISKSISIIDDHSVSLFLKDLNEIILIIKKLFTE